jgi:hypothetical protein
VNLFGRKPPKSRLPTLEPDERIVAWAQPTAGGGELGVGDGLVAATPFGLWLPDRTARLGWHEIHKVIWTGRSLTVIAGCAVATRRPPSGAEYLVMTDSPAVSVDLESPGSLPDQVRTRVNRSIAHTSHHQLPGGGGVRIVARRVRGTNGLSWVARYDSTVDHERPEAVQATDDLVALARDMLTTQD